MRQLLISLALVAGIGLVGVGPVQAATPCAPGYAPCLPVQKDLGCSDVLRMTGGEYVTVTGRDQYGLDRDRDGLGCEPAGVTGPGRPRPTPTSVSPSATPTPVSPSATPTSVSPSATPTSVSPSATPTPQQSATSDSGEPALPVTGSSSWPAVVGGLLLLAVGALSILAVQRRKVHFRA